MNARCDDSSFLMSAMREGFQTGHEYSSLLLTIILNSVRMTTLDLSVNTLITQLYFNSRLFHIFYDYINLNMGQIF